MTVRQWTIVGVLVFLNGFIFTILFLLVAQAYLPPQEVAQLSPTPTKTPTLTPFIEETATPLPPTPTNTRVVPPATPTFTPTATFTPAPPTPTSPPPTPTTPPAPTATFTPTATPTPAFEYRTANVGCYHSGDTFVEGTVWEGGAPKNGVKVRLSWAPDAPAAADYVTGTNPARPGYYEHPRTKGETGTYYIWVVDANGKRISDIGVITFNTEGPESPTACWRGVVDFVHNI